jgi:eukaryotic-like serine/threonine-protein kinase
VQPQVIAGRYEVVRAIGSGGMGTVWLCRDTVLGREVAVKRVGALPGDPVAAQRAMREARIAASLNHANVVGVFDIVDEGDAHWLVMEYVNGESLAEQIRDHGALPPTRVAAIGAAIGSALARAHERGIVHRDVKPGNILIDRAGNPKISDFGIARAHADDQLTQTGFMTGTPSYLSPELARGGDPSPASDVWALGATLYSAVEGEPAYEAQANPLATLQAIAAGHPRPMVLAGPLGGAIAAMMDPDPVRRWDMATAAARLDDIAHGDTTLALPAGAVLPGAIAAGAATEVLADPADATQRLDVPPPVDPAAAATDEEAEEEQRKGPPWIPILIGLLVLALIILFWVLSHDNTPATTPPATTTTTSTTTPPTTTTSSTTSTTTTTTSTTTTTPPTTTTTTEPKADAKAMEDFVRQYYSDVTDPAKRDQTWAQLTEPMQQSTGGRDQYEAFWSTIASVDVRRAKADPASGIVTAQLTFKPKDGSKESRETHELGIVPDPDNQNAFLINSDTKVG